MIYIYKMICKWFKKGLFVHPDINLCAYLTLTHHFLRPCQAPRTGCCWILLIFLSTWKQPTWSSVWKTKPLAQFTASLTGIPWAWLEHLPFPFWHMVNWGGGCFARGQGRSHSAGKSAWERQECESGKNKARKKRNGAKIGVGRTLGQDVDRMILAAMSISHILSSLPALLLLAQIQVDPAGQ